jgi:protein-histidine pros-kinase
VPAGADAPEAEPDVATLVRELRELRERTAELERANEAKDRFLASMSHELRTPLNAVIGFTGVLLMRLPGPLNDEQEQQLRLVQASAKHLLSLVNELVDVARIEAGKMLLSPEKLDLGEVVEDVVGSLLPVAADRGLHLTLRLPPGPLPVVTDRRALHQILLNLVGNAVKFTPEGEVRVAVRAGAGAGLLVEVSDTGPGVDAADQDRIFGAFERGSAARRRGEDGSGLGLYISQRLAELLGTRITVRSAPGEGATFVVDLPGARISA